MHHMHASHPSRIHHNIHQRATQQMHPLLSPHPTGPLVGINVGPLALISRPSPPTFSAQQHSEQQHHHHPHHITNLTPSNLHGSSLMPPSQKAARCIPSHQKDKIRLIHHAQQFNSQTHQTQNKNRLHVNKTNGNIVSTISINAIQQQKVHVQQQKSVFSKSSICHQQHSSLSQSYARHQQLSSYTPTQTVQQQQNLSLSSYSHLLHQQQQPVQSPSSLLPNYPQTIVMQHNPQSQKSNVQQQKLLFVSQPQSNDQHQNTVIFQKNQKRFNSQQNLHQKNLQSSLIGQKQCESSKSQQNINDGSKSSAITSLLNPNTSSKNDTVTGKQSPAPQLDQKLSSSLQTAAKTDVNSENWENDCKLSKSDKEFLRQQQQQNISDYQIIDTVNDASIQISTSAANEMLKNTKEKTSMCLVNELARYNKIQHQYRLTGENGPAHSKRFTVTLKLGDEEYTADGPSIKKAQHSAATEAVYKTKYTHPPMKSSRLKNRRSGIGNITPTVELNALAMKLGKPTIYVCDPPPLSSSELPNTTTVPLLQSLHDYNLHQQDHNNVNDISAMNTHSFDTNLIVSQINASTKFSSHQQNNFSVQVPNHKYFQENYYYQLYTKNNSMNSAIVRLSNSSSSKKSHLDRKGFLKYNSHPKKTFHNSVPNVGSKATCKVILMVGKQKFIGIGDTLQSARHDAASRALEVLKPLVSSEESKDTSDKNTDDSNPDLKSPISLVHETALKRNLPVTFEVKSEKGPPHMKTFITICKVGSIITQGEGSGKKLAKKRAAEKMLEELKKLPPLPSFKINNTLPNPINIKSIKRKSQNIKKKSKNFVKDNSESENNEDISPISKLIQIQQASKEHEPIYTLVEEKGIPRRREFVMEVSACGHTARGSGPNKKVAKKLAAKNLLTLMGYDSTCPNKENNSKIANSVKLIDKKTNHQNHEVVTLSSTATTVLTSSINSNQVGSVKSENVPNLLSMQQQPQQQQQQQRQQLKNTHSVKQQKSVVVNNTNNSIRSSGLCRLSGIIRDENSKDKNPSVINNKNSNHDNISNNNSSSNCDDVRPKDQLLYLADLLGFKVVFSNYPKGNHNEYLTIITLSTDPPQICHGVGSDTDASQDKAAMTALQILCSLGLDNVKPKTEDN